MNVENDVPFMLDQEGYHCMKINDDVVDIVAIKESRVMFIQLKSDPKRRGKLACLYYDKLKVGDIYFAYRSKHGGKILTVIQEIMNNDGKQTDEHSFIRVWSFSWTDEQIREQRKVDKLRSKAKNDFDKCKTKYKDMEKTLTERSKLILNNNQ